MKLRIAALWLAVSIAFTIMYVVADAGRVNQPPKPAVTALQRTNEFQFFVWPIIFPLALSCVFLALSIKEHSKRVELMPLDASDIECVLSRDGKTKGRFPFFGYVVCAGIFLTIGLFLFVATVGFNDSRGHRTKVFWDELNGAWRNTGQCAHARVVCKMT